MRAFLTMAVTIVVLSAGTACAATVDLADGSSIKGDITKQDDKSIEINVDGVTMTYYADEIKDIDGQPFGSQQAAPAAPSEPQAAPAGPAVQPQAPESQAAPEAVNQPEAAPQQLQESLGTGVPESSPSAEAVDPEKRALILQFIDVFGTRQALNANFERMLAQIEKQKPDEAQKIRDRIKVDEIIDRLVPVYDRNFTTDDLRAFIAFYSSPEGQKLIHTIPELMKESVQESIKYMKEKFPEAGGG